MMYVPLALSLIAAYGEARAADDAAPPVLDVQVGQSYIRKEPRALARVLVSNPEVAELKLLEEGQFSVRGVAVGSTDLWIWYRDDVDHPRVYKIVVENDMTDMERRIKDVVSTSPPKVYGVRERIVVQGEVQDVETLERVAALAKVYDKDFVNLMTVKGDSQVQLHVTFAEVSRTGLRELGVNILGITPQAVMGLDSPAQSTSRYLDLDEAEFDGGNRANAAYTPSSGVFNLMSGVYAGPISVGAMLSVMEQNSLARTLAQPTLVALSGQQAEFLAGGEVPIPVAQNNGRISIEFKEYGVKLVFVPTVLGGNVIDMRAYVEVSDIDRSNSTRLSGIEIPAFVSRKGDSHLRLEDGMTFAMAGMLKEQTSATKAKVPLLGDIPVLGLLFRYVKHQREETELVIFVTPELVRPLSAKEVPPPPGATENFNPGDFNLFLMGFLTQPGTRTAEPTGEIGMQR